MTVFFTAPRKGKAKYQKNYDRIVQKLTKLGCKIVSREVMELSDLLTKEEMKDLPEERAQEIFVRKGLRYSNAMIIEASTDSYTLGIETAIALTYYNKPVLCLSSRWDYSHAFSNQEFEAFKYNSMSELDCAIKRFIDNVKDRTLNIRFNAFISKEHRNFLKWYGKKTGKNSSEIIRYLIDKEIGDNSTFRHRL